MRWTPGDRSSIDDQRGRRVIGAAPLGLGGLLILAALSYFTGTDFLSMAGNNATTTTETGAPATTPEEEKMVDFVGKVATDTQETWQRVLGARYEQTRVTLFRDAVESACGTAESATGPFYCPADHKVYLDLGFFQELSERFGAPGDFAQAYVIAHEFGHHVQNLLGTADRARQYPAAGANSASVALELQADCYAGVWGHDASQSGRFAAGKIELEPGDAEEALTAASSIGDDRLQKMATGRVAPDHFTHGTSAQRMQWFKRGMDTGDPAKCDTFGGR